MGYVIPDDFRQEDEDEEFVTIYRNFGQNEKKSIEDAGYNFSPNPRGMEVKEFWLDKAGHDMWINSNMGKPYTATVVIPRSIIGEGNIVRPMPLDGHNAGVVYPENLDAFNEAKQIISIDKVK